MRTIAITKRPPYIRCIRKGISDTWCGLKTTGWCFTDPTPSNVLDLYPCHECVRAMTLASMAAGAV